MKKLIFCICTTALWAVLAGPFHDAALGAEDGAVTTKPSAKPGLILVCDFSLDAAAQEKGDSKGLRGPLQVRKRVKSAVDGGEESPQQKAARITGTLSDAIVAELMDKGVKARRIGRSEAPVPGVWLMEGEFVEYGEGDRMKKAIIGFGSGSSSMGVEVKLSEVTEGGIRPLFDSAIDGKKNRMPGAVVTKNPYVAGAKYVIGKNAPDRDVKKLGVKIADKLVDYMKDQGF